MANVRVTHSKMSRVPGTRTGIMINTFGLDKLSKDVNGDALMHISMEALIPAMTDVFENWPVQTGASRDSIHIAPIEEGDYHARAMLAVGGQQLIEDPRNRSHKDYAPYIEFNGTATVRSGTLTRAFFSNDREMRRLIHEGVRNLIAESLT